MANYKKALEKGYRYKTTKGMLTTEELFGLSLKDLNESAMAYDEKLSLLAKKSFLTEYSKEDTETKEKLEILVDIINGRLEENKAAAEAKATKEHNEKIMRKILEKQEQALDNLSIEELKAQLK